MCIRDRDKCNYLHRLYQSQKTPQMRGFVFSNYQSLNNWNLLLESDRNSKAKMALNIKEWHIKTYIHWSAMKISIIHSQHSLPFLSIKMSCNKNLNLTIRFRYNLRFKKRLWDFRLFIFFKQKRQLERYLVQPPSQPKIQFRFLPFISHILRCYSLISITHCQF